MLSVPQVANDFPQGEMRGHQDGVDDQVYECFFEPDITMLQPGCCPAITNLNAVL